MAMLRTTLLLIVICVLTACEVHTSRYDTLQAAREDQLFERGWVPDVLPESTRSLVEAHNLDTNERCFRASIPTGSDAQLDSTLLRSGFREQSIPESDQPFDGCPFQIPEPSELEILYLRVDSTLDGGAMHSEMEYAAIKKKQEFYYWSGKPEKN